MTLNPMLAEAPKVPLNDRPRPQFLRLAPQHLLSFLSSNFPARPLKLPTVAFLIASAACAREKLLLSAEMVCQWVRHRPVYFVVCLWFLSPSLVLAFGFVSISFIVDSPSLTLSRQSLTCCQCLGDTYKHVNRWNDAIAMYKKVRVQPLHSCWVPCCFHAVL
jgi:hypothetical protein